MPQPVVIIGAGLAGLTVALHLADQMPVIVLAKRELHEAATAWAQGGIVGVLGRDDSIDSHVQDTRDAGGGTGPGDDAEDGVDLAGEFGGRVAVGVGDRAVGQEDGLMSLGGYRVQHVVSPRGAGRPAVGGGPASTDVSGWDIGSLSGPA